MAGENIYLLNYSSIISQETKKYLKDEGYEIHLVNSLPQIEEQLKYNKPDLLLLEVFNLDPNLTKLIESVVNKQEFNDVPFVAVLNRATRNLVLLLAQMGFKEILVRPVEKEDLIKMFEKLIAPNLKTKQSGDGYTVVEVIERLDVTNSQKIDNLIDHLIKQNIKNVVFDLCNISYIDSSGIGILIICKKKLDVVNGVLKVANVNEEVKKVFSTLHINEIIEIVDDYTIQDENETDKSAPQEVEDTKNEVPQEEGEVAEDGVLQEIEETEDEKSE